MSHIVQIQSQIKDVAAVHAACQRLSLPAPVQGKTKLYGGEVEGLAVKLPDWTYPVICDLASGQVKYDNFATCTIDFGHAHNYRGKHRSTVLDTLFGDFCGTDCQNTEP
ncbi:MAG: hypothetical protein WCJ35_26760 [Planctomycetota bacterium]